MNISSKIFLALIIGYSIYCVVTLIVDKCRKKDLNIYKIDDFDFKIVDEEFIKRLPGRRFEVFCAKLFRRLGYDATLTPYENDGGKDIILKNKESNTIFVECKRWSNGTGYYIGREICQKLVGAAIGKGVNNCMIVTTGDINKNAIDYVKELLKNNPDISFEFIDTKKLLKLVKQANKIEKKKSKIKHLAIKIMHKKSY